MKVKYKTAYEFCGSNFVMVIYDEIVESNFRYPDLCETRTGYLTVLEHLPTIKFALIRTTYGFCLTEIKSGCSLIGIQSKSKIFTKVVHSKDRLVCSVLPGKVAAAGGNLGCQGVCLIAGGKIAPVQGIALFVFVVCRHIIAIVMPDLRQLDDGIAGCSEGGAAALGQGDGFRIERQLHLSGRVQGGDQTHFTDLCPGVAGGYGYAETFAARPRPQGDGVAPLRRL